MGLAATGTLINMFIAFVVMVSGEYPTGFAAFMMLFGVIGLAGLIVGASGAKKVGGYIVIGGSIVFVPIGLIGVFGGKRMINDAEETYEVELPGESTEYEELMRDESELENGTDGSTTDQRW